MVLLQEPSYRYCSKLSLQDQLSKAREISQRVWDRIASGILRSVGKEVETEEELAELKAEMTRVRQTQLMLINYRPHLKQMWFHLAMVAIKLYCGSNQSGKTTAQCVEILDRMLGVRLWVLVMIEDRLKAGHSLEEAFSGLPALLPSHAAEGKAFNAMIAAEDFTNAHAENIIPKLNELLPLEYLATKIERIHGAQIHKYTLFNGSTLKLMSYEQIVSKYEGPTWHYVGFDEPPRHPIWGAVIRGTMAKGGAISLAFTPLKEPWTFNQIYSVGFHCDSWHDFEESLQKRPEKFVVTVSLDENPYLTQEAKERAVAEWSPEERVARQHGRFMHLMGRIYKNFDVEVHVRDLAIPIEKDEAGHPYLPWPVGLCIDPHDRRPWAMGWFAINPLNQRIWIEEYPADFLMNEADDDSWDVDAYADYIKRVEAGENRLGVPFSHVLWRICDPNFGRTQNAVTGTTLQYELGNRGLFFDCSVNNDLQIGHAKVREALGDPESDYTDARLFVLPHCRNIRHSFANYLWDDWRGRVDGRAPKEMPKEEFKDFMDVIRYPEVYGTPYQDPGVPNMPQVDMNAFANGGLGRRGGRHQSELRRRLSQQRERTLGGGRWRR